MEWLLAVAGLVTLVVVLGVLYRPFGDYMAWVYSSRKDWKVERGIAQAKDVAMATKQNRIALKGRINFVDERFDDVTIALIDARGCARVQQKIRGPFRKPVVEKPNVLMFLAGPTLNLLKRAKDLFTGGKGEAFYTGLVPAPK